MCPIFQVSNVTGENLELLKMFLNLLLTRMPCNYTAPAEFQIDETFAVPVSAFISMHICVCMYVCMSVCVYVCMCICLCVYV